MFYRRPWLAAAAAGSALAMGLFVRFRTSGSFEGMRSAEIEHMQERLPREVVGSWREWGDIEVIREGDILTEINDQFITFYAMEGDKIVGIMGTTNKYFETEDGEDIVEYLLQNTVYVEEPYRGRGHSTAMYRAALDYHGILVSDLELSEGSEAGFYSVAKDPDIYLYGTGKVGDREPLILVDESRYYAEEITENWPDVDVIRVPLGMAR